MMSFRAEVYWKENPESQPEFTLATILNETDTIAKLMDKIKSWKLEPEDCAVNFIPLVETKKEPKVLNTDDVPKMKLIKIWDGLF